MINLNNPGSKDGALGALRTILRAFDRPLTQLESDEPNDEQPRLKMPAGAKMVDVDKKLDISIDDDGGENEDESSSNNSTSSSTDSVSGKLNKLNQVSNENEFDDDIKAIKKEIEARNNQKLKLDADEKERLAAIQKQQTSRLTKIVNNAFDFSQFEEDIKNAIMSQIEKSDRWEDNYNWPDQDYYDSNFVMPTKKRAYGREGTPLIQLYIDQSGSIGDDLVQEIKQKMSFLETLANETDNYGNPILEYEIYYFANEISKNENDNLGTGTKAFPKILKNITHTQADNVVIITDDDFDCRSQYDYKEYPSGVDDMPYVKVDGYVGWIWPNGYNIARKAYKHLQSYDADNTFQYVI